MNIYISENEKISQRVIHDNIPKKVINLTKKITNLELKNNDLIILPDNDFNFYSQNVSFYQKEAFAIKDFKNILSHIKNDLKWKIDININSNNYIIDNIFVDDKPKEDIFWSFGNIYFDINIISPHKIFLAKSLPKSLWIIKYIQKTQTKNNFVILTIDEISSTLIVTKNWFYEKILELNFGIDQLKKDMIEDNILQFMYDNQITNIITQKIVTEKYTFFAKSLSKRLTANTNKWQDVYIYSKLTKSEIFVNIIKNLLSKNSWYILLLNNILPKPNQINIHISTMILSWVI